MHVSVYMDVLVHELLCVWCMVHHLFTDQEIVVSHQTSTLHHLSIKLKESERWVVGLGGK